jgi:hypothetical protein
MDMAATKKAARRQPFVAETLGSAIVHVHRHFEAEAHFGEFRLGPHGEAPLH